MYTVDCFPSVTPFFSITSLAYFSITSSSSYTSSLIILCLRLLYLLPSLSPPPISLPLFNLLFLNLLYAMIPDCILTVLVFRVRIKSSTYLSRRSKSNFISPVPLKSGNIRGNGRSLMSPFLVPFMTWQDFFSVNVVRNIYFYFLFLACKLIFCTS